MKEHVTIGVVCFGRKTFDYKAAEELYVSIQKDLSKIENTTFECVEGLVIEVEDARNAARELAAKHVDALVCISGTFHLGHLVLEMQKVVNKPLMLWGLPELPYDGGKIRLNSVCGVNLNASNLYKAGVRNFHANIGSTIDEDWVDAVRIGAAISRAHIGIAGFRAHGFFNLGVYDLAVYQNFGTLIDHYELDEIFNMEVVEGDVKARHKQLADTFNTEGISVDQLTRVAELAAKLDAFFEKHSLSALAIRCWPEFAGQYCIAPCASMSLLQSENRIISCEGDLEGALSMIAHRAMGAETPFLFDFSQVSFEEDYALLWHCGVAPCNLWDGKSTCSLDSYHMGGKGVTADFVLKTGDISILRFDSAGEEYRVLLQRAKGVPMEKELKGTYAKVVFNESVEEVLNKVIYNGFAHHASMVYGEYIRPVEIFARFKGWRVVQ